MEKNLLSRAWKGLVSPVNPSTYRGGGVLPKLNGSTFYTVGNFFGYNYGEKKVGAYLNAYGSNPLVYMIVHRIAVTTAGIKIKATNDAGEDIEGRSEILEVLERPNEHQGMKEFLEECYEYFSASGNLFITFIEGFGAGHELKALNPSRMRLVLNGAGEPAYWIYTNNMGDNERIELEDLLHIKTSNIVDVTGTGVYYGLSPLEAAWMVVKSADEIFSAEASIFKNRGIIGILTNQTDTPMLKGERERLQQEFDDEVGGADRFNKLKISNTKLQYIQTGMSPTDLKLLEGIIQKLRILCSIYGLSSVLFNDNENSTYNNVSEAKQSAYTDAYLPLAEKVLLELSSWLSEKLGVDETLVPDITSIDVLKASTNAVAQALNNLSPQVQTRIIAAMTNDEARQLIELGVLTDTAQGAELLGDGKQEAANQNENNGNS